MYITYGEYPMYIREGYPMYIFFSKPGLESEYPPLSGPIPQCTHSRVLGDPPG